MKIKCSVKRNSRNQITRVDDQNGHESRLFREIASHPLVASTEQALDVYQNIFTKDITAPESQISFGHENGQDFRTTLENAQQGQQISAGFQTPEGFHPIMTVVKNTDKTSESGFLQSGILDGIIAQQRAKVGHEYFLQSEGNSEVKKAVTMQMVEESAKSNLGNSSIVKSANTFTIEKTRGKSSLIDLSGNTVQVDDTELDSMSFDELKKKYQYPEQIIFSREWQKQRPAVREESLQNEKPAIIRSEQDLQHRLLDYLNKLGVSVTSISNYVKGYTMRNGVNPGASALADIANRVVAFTDGNMTTEDLTEETAHFINEAMPQANVENVLRNIDKSEEYKEFAEAYRAIYSPEYSGQDLEDAIRREVLGKIVARAITSNFNTEGKTETQKNFIEKALDMFREFFRNIKNYLKPQYQKELEGYLQDVQNLMDADTIDTSNFKNNRFRFYNVQQGNKTDNDKLRSKLKLVTDQLLREINDLQRSDGSGSKVNQGKLNRIKKELDNTINQYSVRSLISMVQENTTYLKTALTASEKNKNTGFLSSEETVLFESLRQTLLPAINEVKAVIDRDYKGAEWAEVSNLAAKVSSDVNSLIADKNVAENNAIEKLADSVTIDRGLSNSQKQDLIKWAIRAESDTSWVQATFGTLINSQDGMVSLLGLTVAKINSEHTQKFQASLKSLQKTIHDNGMTERDISAKFMNKEKTHMISEFDFPAFQKQMDDYFLKAYRSTIKDSKEKDEDILRKYNSKKLTWTDEQEKEILEKRQNLIEKTEEQHANFIGAYRSVTNDNTTPPAEIIERMQSGKLGLDEQTLDRIYEKADKENDKIAFDTERRMTSKYYREYERKLDRLGISKQTRAVLREFTSDFQYLRAKATTPQGKEDFNQLSAQEAYLWEKRQRQRKELKNYFDETGTLKQGLTYARDEQGNIQTIKGVPVIEADPTKNMSPEALTALEVNRFDESLVKTGDKGQAEIPEDFLQGIEDQQPNGRSEELKYLHMNSFMGFTSEFWDNMGGGSITDRLEQVKDTSDDPEAVASIIDEISILNLKRKSILKNHTNKNNPAEIDTQNMTALERDSVREYTESLDRLRSEARQYLQDEEAAGGEETLGESSANEAWKNRIQDLGLDIKPGEDESKIPVKIKGFLEEAKSHMTATNEEQVSSVEVAVRSYLNGGRKSLPKAFTRFLESKGITADELHNIGTYAEMMSQYAEGKLLPYYRRYAPPSYTRFMQDLQDPSKPVTQTLRNIGDYEFMDVRPNYSFFEQDQSLANPGYIKNSGAGYLQPSKKYADNNFKNLFGEVKRDNDTGEYISSAKNQKEFEVYKATVAFKKAQLARMKVEQGYNIYTRPQIRKGFVEKAAGFVKNSQNLKDSWEDLVNFTEDDQVKGEMLGTQGNIIPKKFVKLLENQTDVSADLFTGLALTEKESHLYEARNKYFGDALALQDKIISRGDGRTSQAYKQADAAIQNSIYGVKEAVTIPIKTALFGEVDAAKIVNRLAAFMRFKGLGGSIIIPATAYLTGKSQQVIERMVGQYIDNRSYKLGDSELNKLLRQGAMTEAGQVNTTAKLNVLGQFFGAFELENTIKNSQYGFLARVAPRVPMMLYTAVTYPIYGSNMMSTLFGMRITDGQLRTQNDHRKSLLMQGKTAQEIKADWRKNEGNAIYNYLDVKDGQVVYDKAKLASILTKDGRKLTPEELDSEIARISSDIAIQIKTLNIRVDLQLPHDQKVAAQRHYLLNLVMMFKGFLTVSAENRFRAEGFNPLTRQNEVGSYRDTYRFLGGIIREWKSNGHNIIQAFRDSYENPINEDTKARVAELNRIRQERIQHFTDREKSGEILSEEDQKMKANPLNPDELSELNSLVDAMDGLMDKNMVRKANLKRVAVDVAFVNTLMLISMLLRGWADDDKDNYTAQISNLMVYRLVTEMHQASLGMSSNYTDVLQHPFQAFDSIKSVSDASDFWNEDDRKSAKAWNKLVPFAAGIHQLEDPRKAFDAKRHFAEDQDNAFALVPMFYMMSQAEAKK